MSQNTAAQLLVKTPDGSYKPLQGDANGYLGSPPRTTRLNITAATVVKAGSGTLYAVFVVVAGSAVGSVNDSATTGAAATANQMAVSPTSTGNIGIPQGGMPFTNGLVLTPGTGQTLVAVYA